MLNKYRISNIFPNYIQHNILKNGLVIFQASVTKS